jgi:hypothetical protein
LRFIRSDLATVLPFGSAAATAAPSGPCSVLSYAEVARLVVDARGEKDLLTSPDSDSANGSLFQSIQSDGTLTEFFGSVAAIAAPSGSCSQVLYSQITQSVAAVSELKD